MFPILDESPSRTVQERVGPAPKAWEGEGVLIPAAIIGYLLGSIPFGLLPSRLAGHGDIRQIGSGNIGATNVLRTGSKGLAALTLLLDIGKGLAAAAIARHWGEPSALAAGLGAVLGHMFPVWLGFRGGKGVATALGVLIGFAWPVALAALVIWLAVAVSVPLFVAGGAGRGRGQRRDSSISGRRCDSDPDRRVRALDHPAPSRQHPAPDRGPRAPDLAPERLRRPLAARDLDPEERLDWLRLSRTESIGPITFYAMLRRFGSARAALEALASTGPPRRARPHRHRRDPCGGRSRINPASPLRRPARLLGRARLSQRLGPGRGCAAGPDRARPARTARPADDGGGRRAQRFGQRPAPRARACRGPRRGGLVVVSGLARGIDAAAHLGALDTGTVAVVAGGVDIVYPEENRGLHEALRRQGAIVAELPLGSEPQARHFPRRNRIISGMALGVLVVEAAARSGSLITARYALEQGREVFAVPGSPLDPRCRGANDLLRRGATLTETAEDVLTQLGPLVEAAAPRRPLTPSLLPPRRKAVLGRASRRCRRAGGGRGCARHDPRKTGTDTGRG